jgi:hypothetical protein
MDTASVVISSPVPGNSKSLGEDSHFDIITSLLVLMASFSLALALLWAASRISHNPEMFEHLPEWLKTGYAKLFALLGSSGVVTVAIKTFQKRVSANYLIWIVTLAVLWLSTTLGVAQMLKSPVMPVQPPAVMAEVVPPYKPTLHKEDAEGHPYIAYYDAPGNCVGAIQDATRVCNFVQTRVKIGESNDPFSHWELRVKTPGAPYDVSCKAGNHELNESPTANNEAPGRTYDNNWSSCTGWINGGADTAHMTVKYQMLW